MFWLQIKYLLNIEIKYLNSSLMQVINRVEVTESEKHSSLFRVLLEMIF